MALNSHFSQVPVSANIQRSKFERDQDHKFTMSAGLAYPVFVDEVMPGDTFSMDTRVFARMSTPIHPVMDNCFMDVYYFYIPYRLVWSHFKEFMGEPQVDPFAEPVEYTIPQIKSFITTNELLYKTPSFKSVADYLGLPPGHKLMPNGVSALPFRAYALIWNEWFRNQKLQTAIDFSTGDEDAELYGFQPELGVTSIAPQSLSYRPIDNPFFNTLYVSTAAQGGYLAPVTKFKDYFTSALPEPQDGNPVPIPLSGYAPVIPLDETISADMLNADVHFVSTNGQLSNTLHLNENGFLQSRTAGTIGSVVGNAIPDNLHAALGSLSGIVANISDLRYAFQMQKFLEADNRYGTRYTETIRGHFGVTAPDASIQRPEFLGGKRIRINMNQVLQTSSTDSTSPQGNTAAYSATLDVFNSFTKSFSEWGLIMGIACIRAEHTYQQGIERFWNRKDKFDFYWPEFAHISEQPILNHEIYVQGNEKDYEAFGFQEAWADYRYKPNRISGEMRSAYPQSLDVWHYGELYEQLPTLSSSWISEPRVNIDRTLAVSSTEADQFIVDMYFDCDCVRPMPVYSIPGLAGEF